MKHLAFVWTGYDFRRPGFIWLNRAGGRLGKVVVGFVFSNLIAFYAFGDFEILMHQWLQLIGNKTALCVCNRVKSNKILCDLQKQTKNLNLWTSELWIEAWWENFQRYQWIFHGLPELLASSTSMKLGSVVLVVDNNFSGPPAKIKISLAKKNKQCNYNSGGGLFIQNNGIVSVHVNHLT